MLQFAISLMFVELHSNKAIIFMISIFLRNKNTKQRRTFSQWKKNPIFPQQTQPVVHTISYHHLIIENRQFTPFFQP